MEMLKAFIIERLTVAADEIFGAVQKTIAECQEEVDRTKEENTRLQRLESKPEMKREPQSHGAEEEAPGQQLCEQEYRIILGQENPDTSLIGIRPAFTNVSQTKQLWAGHTVGSPGYPDTTLVKEEQEELWVTQEEEQLPGLDSDTEDLVLTSPCVRTDFDPVLPQPICLYLTQTVENRERTPWDSQLANAAQIRTEPDRDGYGGPGPTSHSLLLSVLNPDGVQSSGLLQSVLKPLIPRRTESPTTPENQFRCKECGKRFNCQSVLNRHVMIHTGARPFKCKECGKCFNRTSVLIRHMMTHTGDKPFKCKECGKCFIRGYHLNRHMRIHTRVQTVCVQNAVNASAGNGVNCQIDPNHFPV